MNNHFCENHYDFAYVYIEFFFLFMNLCSRKQTALNLSALHIISMEHEDKQQKQSQLHKQETQIRNNTYNRKSQAHTQ
jgi:hypothetical protein